MKLSRSTLNHATLHFGGRIDRLSANASHEYSGDGSAAGLPPAADIDIPVGKGSALEKAIDHVAKLIAAALAKQSGVPVLVYEHTAPDAPAKPTRAKRKPATS